MAGRLSRRGFLAGLGGGSALGALGAGGIAGPASAQAFNWKKHAGAKLRVVTLKFPLSEIQQARLADFEQLTGIKVQWEMLPEDLWRQKVKVEHLGGATDLDVFLSYYLQEGKQFLTSGWYTDMRPMMRNPELTSPDFAWDDFIPAVRDAATIEGQVPIIPDRAVTIPILYYRRDLFQQFKLERPKTWQDVAERREDHLRGHQQAGVRDRPPGQGGGRHVDVRPGPLRPRRTVVRPEDRRRRLQHSGGAGRVRVVGVHLAGVRAAGLGEQPLGGGHEHLQPGTRGHAVRRHHLHHDLRRPVEVDGRRQGRLRPGAHGPEVRRLAGPAGLPAERQRPGDLRARQAEGSRLDPRPVPERQEHVEAVHAEGRPGAAPVGVASIRRW